MTNWGLIKLPFELVGTLASPIVNSIDKDVARQLTEKDLRMMVEVGNRAYQSNRIGKEYRWQNRGSGNSGSITLVRKYQLRAIECVETRIVLNNRRKQLMDQINDYCLDAEGKWGLASDIEKQSDY